MSIFFACRSGQPKQRNANLHVPDGVHCLLGFKSSTTNINLKLSQ